MKTKKKKNLIIGYLGPEGTYSYQATQKLFNSHKFTLLAQPTIYDVFEAVATKKINVGVVPAENSTEGSVRETLDYLIEFDLHVNGSIELPINHYLLSKEKKLQDITKIVAHPQTLAQCRTWLQENVPNVALETSSSNISEIDSLKKETGLAFIASEQAGEMYHLQILAENIHDNPTNVTKFYLISRNQIYGGTKKTLLFITIVNRVGVLRDILNVFVELGINLSKIESRPSRVKNWDYYFFIEIDVPPSNPAVSQALDALEEYCQEIEILGGV